MVKWSLLMNPSSAYRSQTLAVIFILQKFDQNVLKMNSKTNSINRMRDRIDELLGARVSSLETRIQCVSIRMRFKSMCVARANMQFIFSHTHIAHMCASHLIVRT